MKRGQWYFWMRLIRSLLNGVSFSCPYIESLEWAAGLSDNWKISYYRGLIQWSVGNTCCALNLLNSCKDVPDYAAFYLSRAELRKDKSGLPDLLMAQNLINHGEHSTIY